MNRRTLLAGAFAGFAMPVKANSFPRSHKTPPFGQGGGGPAYTTGGVAFDGNTGIINNALSSSDNDTFSFSSWLYVPSGLPADSPHIVWDNTVVSTNSFMATGSFGADGIEFNLSDLDNNNSVGGTDNSPGIPFDEWFHILYSVDVSGDNPGIVKMYLNGVDTNPGINSNGSTPYTIAFNGQTITIANPGYWYAFQGYMADFWMAPGQSLLTAGVVSPSTLSKFISGGKPVNLGSAGQAPTGIAPAIFFRRAPGADPSTFGTNLGAGGAFTISGTLTDAPSSPSD